MIDLDDIKPYDDQEINNALKGFAKHPFMKALFSFTFPQLPESEITPLLNKCNSIYDFHSNLICHSINQVIKKSTNGIEAKGFEKLKPHTSYLYLSNHRDIILDSSFLNVSLWKKNLTMTASAIGNNLVKKPSLLTLAKLNRNFIIQRDLPIREALESSKLVSNYISDLIIKEKRSIWLAQRKGRTKDGNDRTEQGIIKMLMLASKSRHSIAYLKKLKIIPVSISCELDPTDILKMPELMAKYNEVEYVKTKNEDFNTILSGVLGQKGRVSIVIDDPLDKTIDALEKTDYSLNKKIKLFIKEFDRIIHKNYKLWSYNYIAYDILNNSSRFKEFYSESELNRFQKRIKKRINENFGPKYVNFLNMYANPVVNKLKLDSSNDS